MKVLKPFLIGGVAGYAIENTLYGPRESAVAHGLPFMPVYGAGAVAFAAASTALRRRGAPWYLRLAAYAASGAAVEYVAYNAEKAAGLPPLWGYGPDGDRAVDVEHALTWGLVGLAADVLTAI